MKLSILLVLILGILTSAGCAGAKEDGGLVSGKVTLNGKPLSGADIKFHNADLGFGVTCPLNEDGTFASVDIVPAATYQIAIAPSASGLEPGASGMPIIPKLPSGLPKKYTVPEKSGVSAEVKNQPQNDFEFDLSSK